VRVCVCLQFKGDKSPVVKLLSPSPSFLITTSNLTHTHTHTLETKQADELWVGATHKSGSWWLFTQVTRFHLPTHTNPVCPLLYTWLNVSLLWFIPGV